ncbi:MAG TPA: ACP S-malonyltransferase [Candidatus Polarisedimenticolia bacterium]|nr:ACP S-malonyltransferase [Candidatus Polarisedimenticolia bacterium]
MSGARKIALVFPGQGSQVVGMGRAAHEAFPEVRAVFDAADRALGFPLSAACFDGPEEALRMTATTQPAILTTSVALLEAMRSRLPGLDARVACAAGHSLGEYSALVAAGALALEDAARVVRRRGEYMQEAVPVGQGAMAAVLGAPLDAVEAMCREAAEGEVLSPANLNAPDQTVVAGHAGAVRRLPPVAKKLGARRVVELPVSAPFHCALMRPAQERLTRDLAALPLQDARFPVLPNVSAEPERTAAGFRKALEEQVTAPVRWVETVRRIAALGVTTLVEIGPGKVLTGLAKRITPDLVLLNVEDPASIDAAVAALDGAAR